VAVVVVVVVGRYMLGCADGSQPPTLGAWLPLLHGLAGVVAALDAREEVRAHALALLETVLLRQVRRTRTRMMMMGRP
jgi:hypothetical protein